MEAGTIVSWEKKEGDKLNEGMNRSRQSCLQIQFRGNQSISLIELAHVVYADKKKNANWTLRARPDCNLNVS